MILEFLKDSVSRSVICQSAVSLMERAGRGIASAGRRSRIVQAVRPFFARQDLFLRMREESVLYGAAKWLFAWILAIVRLVYTAFSHLPPFSWLTSFADWLIRQKVSRVTAVLLAVILCVDDSRWNNGYGFLAALFVSALYLIQRTRETGDHHPAIPASLFLLMFACGLSVFMGSFVSEAMRVFTYFLTAFLFMVVLAGSVRSLQDLREVLLILYGALVFVSVYAIIQAIGGVAVNTSYTDVSTNPNTSGRVYSTLINPNNFAEVLVLLMPCCFAAIWTEERITRNARLLLWASFVLPVLALVLTLSRSAWISFALSVGSFIALSNLWLVPPCLILAILAIPFLPASIMNRIMSLFSGTDTSVGYRVYIWEGAGDTLRENWFLGVGLGTNNFYDGYRRFMLDEAKVATHAHNLYFELWLEMGILGFLSGVTLMLSTLKNTLVSVFTDLAEQKYLAIGLFSALFGLIFMELVEYIWFYPRVMLVFWSILGLAWAMLRVVQSEQVASVCRKTESCHSEKE